MATPCAAAERGVAYLVFYIYLCGEQPPWRDITPRRDGSNRGVTEGIFLHIAIRNQRSTMEVSENVNVLNVLSNIHVKAVPWFIYFSLNSDIA